MLEQGLFDTIAIDRNRLYSQMLDNLNKAAVVGFPYTQIGERLQAAWGGDPAQARVYADAQGCAAPSASTAWRTTCWISRCRSRYSANICGGCRLPGVFAGAYRHLVVDNMEEDTPVAHDLLRDWLPQCDSALLVYDQDAGYRRFLGADPQAPGAEPCATSRLCFSQSLVETPAMQRLGAGLRAALLRQPSEQTPEIAAAPLRGAVASSTSATTRRCWTGWRGRSPPGARGGRPAGGDRGAGAVPLRRLALFAGRPPGALGALARSHRPSRSLREEPAAQCLLTLAALAHPDWELPPTRFDLAYALLQAIDGLDLVRAQLLAEIVYRRRQGARCPDLVRRDQAG